MTNNLVSLDGYVIIPPSQSPDGCTWKMHHHIEGNIPSGMVTYSYAEAVIVKPPGLPCWSPDAPRRAPSRSTGWRGRERTLTGAASRRVRHPSCDGL